MAISTNWAGLQIASTNWFDPDPTASTGNLLIQSGFLLLMQNGDFLAFQ